MRDLRRFHKRINKLIQFMVKLAHGLFKLVNPAARKLLLVFGYDGLCNFTDARRRENVFKRLLNDVPLNEILFLIFLMAGVRLFSRSTGIVIIPIPVTTATAGFAHHVGAAIAAECLALQKIFYFRLIGGGRAGVCLYIDLRLLKQCLIDHRFGESGDDDVVVLVLADIGRICENAAECIIGESAAMRATHATSFQLIDDVLHGHTVRVLLKEIAYHRRFLFIDHQLAFDNLVPIGDAATAKLALRNRFTPAAEDFLSQVERVVFSGRFQKRLQKNGFVSFADVFHCRDNADSVLLELVLIQRRVIAVACEAIQLPDEDTLKLLFLGIDNHALKIRPVICSTGDGAVNVFADDGNVISTGILIAIAQLTFDGLLGLVVRRVSRINDCVHKIFPSRFTRSAVCAILRNG